MGPALLVRVGVDPSRKWLVGTLKRNAQKYSETSRDFKRFAILSSKSPLIFIHIAAFCIFFVFYRMYDDVDVDDYDAHFWSLDFQSWDTKSYAISL